MSNNDSRGRTLRPAFGADDDGLESFATEGVLVVDSADDVGQLVESPPVLPMVRAVSVPPAVRHPPVMAGGWRMLAAGVAILVVSIYGYRVGRQTAPPTQAPAPAQAAPESTVSPPAARESTVTPPALPREQLQVRRVEAAAPADRARALTATPTRRLAAPDAATTVARPDRAAVPSVPAPAASSEAGERAVAAPSVDARVDPLPDLVTRDEVRLASPVREEAPPAAAPIVVAPPVDRVAIERVLQAYESSYDRLDAPSAAVIWPRVDTRALSRAFGTLSQQDMSFDRCDLSIAGARANARCTGEIRYVRRVGDQIERVRHVSWSFALERVSDRWQIERVTAD